MVSAAVFKELCLSMPGAQEAGDHWGNPAFRTKRRIFTVLRPDEMRANFNFTPDEQAAYCQADSKSFFPVEGGWGKMGWTTVDLRKVSKKMLTNAINSAWYNSAPPKLREQYREEKGL